MTELAKERCEKSGKLWFPMEDNTHLTVRKCVHVLIDLGIIESDLLNDICAQLEKIYGPLEVE